jgi:hypothetical protein
MSSIHDKTKSNIYQIRIKGHLGSQWSGWFDDFTITLENDGTTTLIGKEEDDSALYGLLKKVRDSGMPLLSLNIVDNVKEKK